MIGLAALVVLWVAVTVVFAALDLVARWVEKVTRR